MPRLMLFNCIIGAAFIMFVYVFLVAMAMSASDLVPCSKYEGQPCEMRKECKKCTRCTDASDQCCCLHVDACGCDIFCFPEGADEDFKEAKSALRLIAPERP